MIKPPSIYNLITEIRRVAGWRPSIYQKVQTKETILARIHYQERTSLFSNNFGFNRFLAYLSIASIFFFVLFNYRQADIADAHYVGTITMVSGNVEITRNNQTIEVSTNSPVQIGDQVHVANASLAEITFIDHTVTKLFANTEVAISNLLIDKANVNNSLISINLQKGELENIVQNKVSDQAKLEIKTPTSVVDTQAANFTIKVSDDGITKVKTTSNLVTVRAIGKDKGTELASAKIVQGYEATINKNGSDQKVIELKKTSGDLYAGFTSDTNQATSPTNRSFESGSAAIVTQIDPLIVANNQLVTDVNTQLGFAKVKLHQASSMFSVGNRDKAYDLLLDYAHRNENIYNMLAHANVNDDFSRDTLETILLKSHLKELTTKLDDYRTTTDYNNTKALINYLAVLEKTLQDNIVMNSLVKEEPILDTKKPVNPIYKTVLPGTITSKIDNIITLKSLIKNTGTAEDNYELEMEIQENLRNIIKELNGLNNAKVQHDYLETILASFPSTADFEEILTPLSNML